MSGPGDRWKLDVRPRAQRQLARLPEKIAAPVTPFVRGPGSRHDSKITAPNALRVAELAAADSYRREASSRSMPMMLATWSRSLSQASKVTW